MGEGQNGPCQISCNPSPEIDSQGVTSDDDAISSWPEDAAFISITSKPQLGNGCAVCTQIAMLNDNGEATLKFHQGERVHFYFEFAVLQDIEVPAGGVELKHESGVIVHGKNSFQQLLKLPERVPRGMAVRFHQWIELGLMAGRYSVGLGLAGTSPLSYAAYSAGCLSHPEFHTEEYCRVLDAISFEVHLNKSGHLTHHGIADLPGGNTFQISEQARFSADVLSTADRKQADPWPTLLHITHWKAGSQWINKILHECAPDRIVEPQPDEAQVRYFAMQAGHVYPTVYLSKSELDKVPLPENTKKFVVIRDLRDTLISGYWSFKCSHPILVPYNLMIREMLSRLDFEDGMLYLMEHFITNCAAIQLSWIESAEPILKYEDLLESDTSLLEDLLIRKFQLPLDPGILHRAILANRFQVAASGRKRGEEDRLAHERKGVAGDWRNHFTNRMKKKFKARFGGLLVASGYEKGLDW